MPRAPAARASEKARRSAGVARAGGGDRGGGARGVLRRCSAAAKALRAASERGGDGWRRGLRAVAAGRALHGASAPAPWAREPKPMRMGRPRLRAAAKARMKAS